MKWLVLNTNYPEFLTELYAAHPDLAQRSYDEQLCVRNNSLFGAADVYAANLNRIGEEAWDLHLNNEPLQCAWAREHGVPVEEASVAEWCARAAWSGARFLSRRLPMTRLKPVARAAARPWSGLPRRLLTIAAAQVAHYRPDVILNQTMETVSIRFLRGLNSTARLIIGQIAAPLPPGTELRGYDLVLSSLPNFVGRFRQLGVPSALHRLGFESSVLERVTPDGRPPVPVSFVGTLSEAHQERMALLEALCRLELIEIWGWGIERIPASSPIHARYRGTAWGMEMYQILRASRLTVNHHVGVAGIWANNSRLFEATGMGTCLLTDWKANLREFFEPGREVVVYRTPEECAEHIRHYLDHEPERVTIARAGQQRTLGAHTYWQRMRELVDLVENRERAAR